MRTLTEVRGSQAAPDSGRFTRRLTFFEEPAVATDLEQLARDRGCSTAAEIRAAIRWWLRAHEDD